MFAKREFVIGAASVYLLSVILFFVSTSESLSEHCYDKVCVRFCCNDKEKCSSKFIKDNFNQSLIPAIGVYSKVDVKIFYGKPQCILEKLSSNIQWNFDEVSKNFLTKERNKMNKLLRMATSSSKQI